MAAKDGTMAPDIQPPHRGRERLNRLLMVAPVLCSIAALALVLGNIAAHVPPQRDEGAAAHAFQLLIAGQVPLVMLFVASADWTRPARPLLAMLVQALAGLCGLGALAWSGY